MAAQKVNDKSSNDKPKTQGGAKSSKSYKNRKPKGRSRNQYQGKQGRRDSDDKRVNLDNERVSRYREDVDNDVAWYAKNPEMLLASASLPTYNVVGGKLPWAPATSVPGAMALYWMPSIGGNSVDAINQAMFSMYSYVVHANSRNQSYDPQDLMILTMCGINVFSTLAHVIRAYGVAKMYSEMNMYYPDGILKLMGFDPDDVRDNLSQMWFDINEMVARSTQIWVPKTMPVLFRQYWMNSNIYTDADSIKAQLYFYVPEKFYVYDDTSLDTGGIMRPYSYGYPTSPWTNNHFTTHQQNKWSAWKKMINAQFEALLNSQDRGIIYGDILKAYGMENIFAMSSIPVDFRATISYSTEVLSQIENALVCPGKGLEVLAQDQTSGRLKEIYSAEAVSAPYINQVIGFGRNTILNFHTKTPPTAADIMVATRMRVGATQKQAVEVIQYNATDKAYVLQGKEMWRPATNGTEVLVSRSYAEVTYASNAAPVVNVYNLYDIPYTTGGASITATKVMVHEAFDWAPWLYEGKSIANLTGEVGAVADEIALAIGDFDVYTILNTAELEKMHTAAIYSEFGVPQI